MSHLWQDIRYAVRTLSKARAFTLVAVLSLALGIGANTAIFTLVDQALLRLLPVNDPQRLVLVSTRGSSYGNNRGSNALSYPMYEDFRDQNKVFDGVICRYGTQLSMSFNGRTERISGDLVSGNYFPVLGVPAYRGRAFTPEDDRIPGGHPLAMLSYGFWQSRFAGDPAIVGKTIRVNELPMTIIGITPPGFTGTDPLRSPQVFVPMMMKAQMTPGWDDMKNRRSRWLNVFARLKPGVSLPQAESAMQALLTPILQMEVQQEAFAKASSYTREQFVKGKIHIEPASTGGNSGVRREIERPLWVLMAIVGFVLLIACANVANLMLVRAGARQKEIAIRFALGGTRLRIIAQLLVESVMLSVAGGVFGLGVAWGADRVLLRFLPDTPDAIRLSATPDLRVFAFTLALSVFTGVLFGLVPAFQATRAELTSTLKEQAGSVMGGRAQGRLRRALVVGQVALSLLLLIGAVLFVRSLRNLRNLDPGFRTERLVMFAVDPSLNGYKPEKQRLFYRQLLDNLRTVPGVSSATLATVPLMRGWEWDSTTSVEGYEAKPDEDMNPFYNAVAPEYFATMGIPLVNGRDFTDNDEANTPKTDKSKPTVCIVNEKFARKYFGGRNPLGRHIGQGGDPGTKLDIEIVGVVKDAKYTNLRDDIPKQVFVPYMTYEAPGEMYVLLRTGVDPTLVMSAVRSEVHKMDANLPIYDVKTMDAQIDDSLGTERLVASLSTSFGALATFLAMLGLYGTMAYAVAKRSREIGIRMALGALPRDVAWMVLREVLILIAVGVGLGLPSAWGLTRYVRAQLYGVSPTDPATIAMMVALIVAVAVAAGYIPARRAASVDPMRVLRYE